MSNIVLAWSMNKTYMYRVGSDRLSTVNVSLDKNIIDKRKYNYVYVKEQCVSVVVKQSLPV